MTQQAVGWALHALEPDEEMAVLLHLPQCPTCQAAAIEAEQVLAGLGASVPLIDPPAGLRDRLLADVAQTPQHPPILRPRTSQESAPVVSAPGRRLRLDAEDATPPRKRRFTSWGSSRGRRLVAASLAAVAVLSVGGLAVRTTQLEQQRDAEISQAQGLSELIAQMGEPGSQHALLVDSAGATVAAVLVRDGQRQVYTVDLPANGDESVYVAWGKRADGSAPVPLGAFDVAAADQGLRTVGSVAEAEDFAGYAISIEPGRVAPATPTQVVASGQVAV